MLIEVASLKVAVWISEVLGAWALAVDPAWVRSIMDKAGQGWGHRFRTQGRIKQK